MICCLCQKTKNSQEAMFVPNMATAEEISIAPGEGKGST